MPKRPSKADLDDGDEKPADCYTPKELVERERAERCADVKEQWWYRDRYGEGVFLRFRLEAEDCDVTLQTFCDGEHWVTGWPANKKVPLYRAYEGGEPPLFIVEGEYAADWAAGMGLSAVTSAGGPEDVGRSDWRPAAGRRVVILPRNCDDGRRFARAVAGNVLALDPPAEVRMLSLPGLEEGGDIVSFSMESTLSLAEQGQKVRELANQRPVMKPADVAGWPVMRTMLKSPAAEVRWLWRGRVPIGKPMVIYGGLDPGKSILALNLAAKVSAGAEWPVEFDGEHETPRAKLGNVILMSKDHLRDTVRPRLDLAGADPQRIITVNSVVRIIEGKEVRRDITLRDLADLERAIELAGGVRLLVIDPLWAFFGAERPTRHQVYKAITALADLGDRYGFAVVITSEVGGRDGLGFGANMTLMSTVGSAWMLADEPGNRKLLLPIKSIVGQAPGGLACSINANAVEWEPAPIADDRILQTAMQTAMIGSGLSLPAVSLPDPSNPPAGSLLAVSVLNPPNPPKGRRGPKPVCREVAVQWLARRLADGPVPVGSRGSGAAEPGTLRAAAKSAGLAWTNVHRAFQDLKVLSQKSADTGKHVWRLPAGGSAVPASEEPDGP